MTLLFCLISKYLLTFDFFVDPKSKCNSAPGAYSPEKATVNNAPKYSFGLKTIHEKQTETPGKCKKSFRTYLNDHQRATLVNGPCSSTA